MKIIKSNRIAELDVLRGIAAVSVVLYHFQIFNLPHLQIIGTPFKYGFYGVHLFFMISGFVIFMTLEKAKRPLDFVISRFARLFPAYWFAICLTLFFIFILPNPPRELTNYDILFNFTMLQEYFGHGNVDGSYWSLSFELAFYLTIFILFYFIPRRNIELISISWLSFYLLILIGEHFGLKLPKYLNILLLSHYVQLFIAGMIFYKIRSNGGNLKKHCLIFLCLFIGFFIGKPIESGLIFGLFFAIFYAFVYNKIRFIVIRPLVFLGTISYSLYLIHHQIGLRIMPLFNNSILGFITSLLAVFALATIINMTIERPCQKLIKNVFIGKVNPIKVESDLKVSSFTNK